MTITLPPPAPDPNNPGTFNDRAAAFVAWWVAAIPEYNELAVATGPGLFLDGTAAAPGISFVLDPNTGFRRPAADQIAVITNGVQRLLWTTTAMQLDVPLTGTAVTQTSTDTTANRVMKVGDFGLGGAAISYLGNVDDNTIATGFYFAEAGSTGTKPGGFVFGHLTVVRRTTGDRSLQVWTTDSGRQFRRAYVSAAWTAWREIYGQESVLAVVAQVAGVPTGGLIERNTNANGEYVRIADGTQMCNFVLNSGSGGDVTWTFPAAFISTANMFVGITPASASPRFGTAGTITTTTLPFSVYDIAGARVVVGTRLFAFGRWF